MAGMKTSKEDYLGKMINLFLRRSIPGLLFYIDWRLRLRQRIGNI